jgi:hypothetical protein
VWLKTGSAGHGPHTDVDTFVKHVLPKFNRPFVLITSDGDFSIPSAVEKENVQTLLASPSLLAWYTQNFDGYSHEKLFPVPIGFDLHTGMKDFTGIVQMQEFRELIQHRVAVEGQPLRSMSIAVDSMAMAYPERKDALKAVTSLGCVVHNKLAKMARQQLWGEYANHTFGLSPSGKTGRSIHEPHFVQLYLLLHLRDFYHRKWDGLPPNVGNALLWHDSDR